MAQEQQTETNAQWLGSIEEYKKQIEKAKEELKKQQDELKRVANRLFSTEDGKVLARAMIRSCRMLEAGNDALPNDELQRLRANQDFVNTFITKLVDRKVFIGILEEI